MKKALAMILAATMAFSLVACGGAPASGSTEGSTAASTTGTASTEGKKTLAVQVGTNLETIDPGLNTAADVSNMIITMFEPLLIMDENNTVQPGQAEKWEVSEDGLTWTFTLRDGLKWSNGESLTAEDFVYTLNRIADPKTAAPYGETAVGMIKGYDEVTAGTADSLAVSAPDEKTLVIELAYPCSYFDKMAAFAALSPVNKTVVEADPDGWCTKPETYVSNGPYMMKEWTVGQQIVCEKNPHYNGGWDKDKVVTDEITFLLMEDSTAAYTAYQTNQAQLIKNVPSEEIPSLTPASEGGDFHVEPIMGTSYISFNAEKEPFNDPLVRKALTLAVDREYITNVLMEGTGIPAYNVVGPGISDNGSSEFVENSSKDAIPDDYETCIAQAQQALAEAGYPGGEGFPVITYTTNDAGHSKVIAEYMQTQYKDVLGIDMKVEIVEWASFTAMRRAGDYEMARNGWVMDYDDASNTLETFISDNGNNDGKVSIPEVDQAMEASKVGDSAEHFAQLHKAEDVLMENYAVAPLTYSTDVWLQSPSLKGSWHSPYGYWYLQYAYVEE